MFLPQVESINVLFAFCAALTCSFAVIATTKWHGKFTLDGTNGIQKNHLTPIPRIGGISIMSGLIAVYLTASADVAGLLEPLLIAGLPAFLFGLAEDLTKRVSVRARLLATMSSGVMAWVLTGTSINHADVWGVDFALAWLPFSVLFTAFAVGGVANAVNIIDGFNGLASGTAAICIFAVGVIAAKAGDTSLADLCFGICCVIMGFLVVNFPLGKLFLGDGGAYMLGFLMAWLAIMLPTRNPSVSVWASFLACGYPIFETLFTVCRRVWARNHPGQPDCGHLHSLVKVAVTNRLFGGLSPAFRNALVSPFCWAIALLAAVLAVRHSGNTVVLMFASLTSFLVYLAFYSYVKIIAGQTLRRPVRPSLVVVPIENTTLRLAEPGNDAEEVARAKVG